MSGVLIGTVGDAWVKKSTWTRRGVAFLRAAEDVLGASFDEYQDGADRLAPWLRIPVVSAKLLDRPGGLVFRSRVAALRLRGGELVFFKIQLRNLSLRQKIEQTPGTMFELMDAMERTFEPSRSPAFIWLDDGRAYPRPRIPYQYRAIPLGHTWWALDERYHLGGGNFADPDRFERLTRGPLPEGWTREQRGTYWIFDTGVRTDDPVAYNLARGRQHQQLGQLLDLERDSNFSPEGDERVSIGQAWPDPDLYAYAPVVSPTDSARGWIELAADHAPGEALRRHLQALVDAGRTPFGTKVSSIGVVAPDRPRALACRQLLGEQVPVVYRDAQHGFWDPYPDGGPGGWLPER